ncbi:MAG: hypothetical protein R3F61_30125 [Myxococcota bacterium]
MTPPLAYRCSRRWDELEGSGDTRWCASCSRPVHDLDALAPTARARLLGSLAPACVRFAIPALLGLSGAAHAEPVVPGEGPLPVIEEKPVVMGSLDREWIRRMVTRDLETLRAAYTARRLEKPGLAGRIVVRFTLVGTAVTTVEVTSDTVGDGPFRDTVIEYVRDLEPGSDLHGATLVVSWPFVFAPPDPP